MRRKQITGADLLSELHSYNGNDKRYSESKVTEAAKAVDNGNYQESETAAEYAMKKLKAHYGVEDQDNNEDIAKSAQSGLQKIRNILMAQGIRCRLSTLFRAEYKKDRTVILTKIVNFLRVAGLSRQWMTEPLRKHLRLQKEE